MDGQQPSATVPLASGGETPLMVVKDTRAAVRWALGFLGFMRALCKMPAVCFDIDGTVLMNLKDGRTKSDNYMKLLLEACRSVGITVFYVTARPDEPENRRYTERQLSSAGLDLQEKLYMMPKRAEYGSYKWKCRRDIEKQGYTILLSVGDQLADLNRDLRQGEAPVSASQGKLKLRDDLIYVGRIGDNDSFGIKLPSEFL